MSIFKLRYDIQGHHIRCRLFATMRPATTWANCGELTFRKDEFFDFLSVLGPEVETEGPSLRELAQEAALETKR